VKYLKKFSLFIIALLALFIFFLPKTQLYYQAEQLLAEEKIMLSSEMSHDYGFLFNLTGGTLFYDDLEVAKLEKITLTPLIFFNRINVEPFTFSQEMQNFIPGIITQMRVQYSIIDPLHILLSVEGDFGSLNGSIAFLDQQIKAVLIPSKTLLKQRPIWLKEFKKQEGGVYHYESAY